MNVALFVVHLRAYKYAAYVYVMMSVKQGMIHIRNYSIHTYVNVVIKVGM